MITFLILSSLIAGTVGGWKAGRRYQQWRAGPGWKRQLPR